MSTRVVTLLFTDLVSSTEISQRLGEDAAEDYRRAHFRILREAVTAHGGEEVKNLGDGLMVVFESPSDAIACGVAMQQGVEHHNRRANERIDLRVGLHMGEVTQEDGDYFGTAVVVAERLSKVAGPAQILASDVLRLIVGSRGGHGFSSLGSLDLKGVPDPVGAVEVGWEPLAAESISLPHALSVVEINDFVGRSEEREQLLDAFKRARAGERQLVFLVGEPGMGKSRLCGEFAREVYAAGATVLYGRCDEESLAPYQPFVEALRHYVSVCPPDELRAQAGPTADDLARLVPDLARRVPGVTVPPTGIDAEADRLRLFDAVRFLLAEASVEQTVVLILDDLHWADRPTLQLLRHLLRAEPFPILLVATYRETDLDRAHPLATVLADLRREHPFERLHMKGLDIEEIVQSLERAAGQDIGRRGRRLAEALAHTTDGNPFFIIQILGHLTDTGRIYEQDGVWTFDVSVDELGIPEGVKEVVGRRISSLSEDANKALGVAAVLGRDFSLDILERVADMSSDELVDALDEAVRAGIVLEARGAPGRYSFAHALVRETLYEELTATRRVRLHRRTVSVLEELAAGDEDRFVSELAYHYLEAAQVTEVDKAIDYARRAAKRAVSLIAYEEGVRLYERAIGALDLGEAPDDSMRLDLLLELGDAQWKAGDVVGSRETFDRARSLAKKLDNREAFGAAALGFVGPPESGFPRQPGVEALEEVLELLPPDDSETRARVSVRLAMFLATDPSSAERRAALAREAVDMSKRIGDIRTIAYVLRGAPLALWEPNNLAREIEFADEVIRLGEQEGDKELIAYGNGWRSIWLLWTGDTDASDAALAVQGELGAQLKQPFMRWAHGMWTACRKQMRGELDEAEQLANESFELAQQVVPDGAVPIYAVQVAAIRWLQGRFAEVEPVVKGQVEAFPEIPAWRCTLANIYAETDQRDKAHAEFEHLASAGFPIPRDAAWPIAIARLGVIAAYLGDAQRAETLYELFEPYAGQNVVVAGAISSAGAVHRYLGLAAATMSKWNLAEQHFRDGIEQNERMRARPFVALTQYDLASMLLRRAEPGDAERAQELLDAALATAREIGMATLIEQIGSVPETSPALD